MSRTLGIWVAMLFVFSGACLIWFGSRYMKTAGSASEPDETFEEQVEPLTEFELVDQNGKVFHSDELKGQVWAGSFFFAQCTQRCFNQNTRLYELQKSFADKGIQLQLISITCDPKNDTPDALSRYSSRFLADPTSWRFLAPADRDPQYVQRIGNDYFGLPIDEETHSDQVVVFDRDGKSRGTFGVLNAEQFADLKKLLGELLSEEVNSQPSG